MGKATLFSGVHAKIQNKKIENNILAAKRSDRRFQFCLIGDKIKKAADDLSPFLSLHEILYSNARHGISKTVNLHLQVAHIGQGLQGRNPELYPFGMEPVKVGDIFKMKIER